MLDNSPTTLSPAFNTHLVILGARSATRDPGEKDINIFRPKKC